MRKSRSFIFGVLTLVICLALLIAVAAPSINATQVNESDPQVPTDPTGTTEAPLVREGLVAENGNIYFYNEDGSLFTDGYKEVAVDGVTKYYFFQEDGTAFTGGYKAFTKDGVRVYYYFQEDGTAYTDGYLSFAVAGKDYYFYFQEDGSAFTGGYKEITLDGKLCYFYFLSNGQGYNTGYKTVMIDGKKYYFYFGSNGQAVTNAMESIPLGDRTAYMLFNHDGKAYTGGYKEVESPEGTDYYYFLSNGQAFTTGYKTVKIDDVTHYFYFEENGKAFTDGWKAVPFGTQSYDYFFQDNGRAKTAQWETTDGTDRYLMANGRVARNAFATIDGSIYYFDENYTVKTGGWFCVGNGYYYATDTGALLTDTVVEGYALDSAGKSSTKYRIIQYVNEHTDPSMTDQEKIEALYDWVLKGNMKYISGYEHVKADWDWPDNWVDYMATSLMDNWGGNCFRFASFFGMMVHEATGLPVAVYHGKTPRASGGLTAHGWAAVYQDGQWYVYDPELQKFTGYARSSCYQVLATDSYLHVQGVGTNLFE